MDSGCSRTRLTLTTSTRNTRAARLAASIATHMRVATSSHDQITMRNCGLTGIRRSRFRLTKREQSISAHNFYSARDHGQTWDRISPDLTTNDPRKQKQEQSGGV